MTDNSIPKQVLEQLGKVGSETAEKAVEEAGKIGQGIISGKELLGTVKPMSPDEYQNKQVEDDKKKKEEIEKLMGRNVEGEIKQIRDEKAQKEEEEERLMLENIKRQREAEEMERQQMVEIPGNSEREAKKRQFVPGPKKKTPDPSQMSATSEFKGGKID